MRRSVKKIVVSSLVQSKYLFKIRSTFSNWISFILNRLRVVKSTQAFYFRNGLKINMDREHDDGWSPTIVMDIFIKDEYGKIEKNTSIIDVGANIGAFSLLCSYNLNCRCYAFQPDSVNYDILLKNIEENDLTGKIIPQRAALSSVNGQMKLYKSISMSHSLNTVSDNFELVDSVTLEEVLSRNNLEYVDYLKMDCEGGEYDILYNSDPALFKKIKNILLEYHYLDNEKQNGKYLIDFIKSMGYFVVQHKILSDKLGIIIASNQN